MRERINPALSKILDSITAATKAIEKAFEPERPMPLSEFVMHARVDGVARIEVMPYVYQERDFSGGGWAPSLTAFSPKLFRTRYRSYDAQGKLLKGTRETHAEVTYTERRLDEQSDLQNILTAHNRVLELRQLLPGVEVELDLPGFLKRPDAKRRQEILSRAQDSGLEPFPRIPIAMYR